MAFSSDGSQAVCHTYTPGSGTNDEGIFIISIYGNSASGTITYYITYPNSNKGYDYMRKNILMESLAWGSTDMIYFQASNGDFTATNTYQIYGLSIPLGASSFTYQSNSDGEAFALGLGSTSGELYSYQN